MYSQVRPEEVIFNDVSERKPKKSWQVSSSNRKKCQVKEIFQCPYKECQKTFPDKWELTRHDRRAHTQSTLCPFGCKKLLKPSSISTHIGLQHCQNENVCRICNKKVSKKDSYRHVKFSHTIREIQLRCTNSASSQVIQLKKIAVPAGLERKLQIQNSSNLSEKQLKFKCKQSECFYSSYSKHRLKAHVYNVHAAPNVLCPFNNCQKSYRSNSLIPHVKRIHNRLESTCIRCRKEIPAMQSVIHLLTTCKQRIDNSKVSKTPKSCAMKKSIIPALKDCRTDGASSQDLRMKVSESNRSRLILCPDSDCDVVLNNENFHDHLQKLHKNLTRVCCKCNSKISYFQFDQHTCKIL